MTDGADLPDEKLRPWESAAKKRRDQGSRLGLPNVIAGQWWTPLLVMTFAAAWMLSDIAQEHSHRLRLVYVVALGIYIVCMLWAAAVRLRRRQ